MTFQRWIIVLVLAALALAVWNRRRIYVRDPLGSVTRNGVEEQGAQVLVSSSGDVLIQNYNAPMYVTLIQREDRVGTPAEIHCVAYVACLLDADQPALLAPEQGVTVSTKGNTVVYRDADGRETVVTLR